jgi:hypothetical protein
MADTITLPTNVKFSVSMKQMLIILLAIGLGALAVFLIVTGKWKEAQRLMLKLKIKQHDLEIFKLDTLISSNKDKIDNEGELRKKLEKDRQELQKQRITTQLEMEGKTHEEIVSKLTNLGL